MNDLTNLPQASPFDQIKHTDETGSEFWSARDLMPLLGYEKWERFSDSIQRAEAVAANQGVQESFSRRRETASGGGRPREDVIMSRYGAYLVAMNGDPRKPEVAAAQSYFAIRTREAETMQPRELSRLELIDMARDSEMARLREVKARQAVESYAKELEPKADAYTAFLDSDGVISVGAVAKMIGLSQNKLFDLLRNTGVFIAKGHMRNTPYQQYMHHFRVNGTTITHSDGRTTTSYTTRVQPSGVDFIRRKLGLFIQKEMDIA